MTASSIKGHSQFSKWGLFYLDVYVSLMQWPFQWLFSSCTHSIIDIICIGISFFMSWEERATHTSADSALHQADFGGSRVPSSLQGYSPWHQGKQYHVWYEWQHQAGWLWECQTDLLRKLLRWIKCRIVIRIVTGSLVLRLPDLSTRMSKFKIPTLIRSGSL